MERQAEAQVAQSLTAAREIKCKVCSRKFRRESDRKRHKCLKERSLPVSKQRGAAQCQRATSGLEAGVAWLSTHADHREAEGHMGTKHKTCLCLRDHKTAATNRTGLVCVCVCVYVCV